MVLNPISLLKSVGVVDEFAKIFTESKAVSLLIKNHTTKNLVNPQVRLSSGKIKSILPYVIKPDESGKIAFHKTFGLRAAIGTVTYDVEHEGKRLCIFYCNPTIGYNCFNIKWKSTEDELNKELVNFMDKRASKIYLNGTMKWHEEMDGPLKAAGLMCQHGISQLHVYVFELK